MNILKKLLYLSFIVLLYGCEKDDHEIEYIGGNTSGTNSSTSIKAPTFDRDITTTDLDGFSIRLRFTNGGDVSENMKCKVHWAAYSSKPSKTPNKSDLNRSESMRMYTETGTTLFPLYGECRNGSSLSVQPHQAQQ